MEAKEYLVFNDARSMAVGKVLEDDEDYFTMGDFKFLKVNGAIEANLNLLGEEVVEIKKDGETWSKISKKLFDDALKILKAFRRPPNIALQEEPNSPILVFGNDLGIIIAHKLPTDKEEDEDE